MKHHVIVLELELLRGGIKLRREGAERLNDLWRLRIERGDIVGRVGTSPCF